MNKAIEQGKKSIQIDTAYCVGCVIINESNGIEISNGFSRELPGNTHAEECALDKIKDKEILGDLVMYTTMEPCSNRLSGKQSCTDRIMQFNRDREGKTRISRVVIGVKEPDHFVKCDGTRILQEIGKVKVEYEQDQEIIDMCAQLNAHIK
jgi:pyrimidine deaminase RibD-like protein